MHYCQWQCHCAPSKLTNLLNSVWSKKTGGPTLDGSATKRSMVRTTLYRALLIRSTSKLSLKIYFFAIFLVPSWFLKSMGAVPQNWLIPQKFHKKQSCRVSKSKIIMCLWSVALKARKAAKWPRTFYMVWTVEQNKYVEWIHLYCIVFHSYNLNEKLSTAYLSRTLPSNWYYYLKQHTNQMYCSKYEKNPLFEIVPHLKSDAYT